MNSAQRFEYLKGSLRYDSVINAAVLNVMRTLGKVYPTDSTYGEYRKQSAIFKEGFYDFYHLLWNIGAVINPMNIMEIGCRSGTSLIQLLSSMSNLEEKHVVVFDSFLYEMLSATDDRLCSEEMVRANLEYLNLPAGMIEFVVGLSQETIPAWKEKNPDARFDYILVDGCHLYEEEKTDLENSAEMLAPGGVLLMDDIATPDLHKLWDEFKAARDDGFLFAENLTWKGVGMAVKT
jgi:predicted O-methyltransferase YrrM